MIRSPRDGSALPYRPNVGIALFNRQGYVFAGRGRSAGPEIVEPGFDWQLPQGSRRRPAPLRSRSSR